MKYRNSICKIAIKYLKCILNLILKGGVVSRRIFKQILSTELRIANKEKSPSPSFLYKVLLYYIYLWLSGFRSWPWRKGMSKKLTREEYNWTLALILFKEHSIIINIFTFSFKRYEFCLHSYCYNVTMLKSVLV